MPFSYNLESPLFLLIIIPAIIFVFFLIKKQILKEPLQKDKKLIKKLVLFSRIIIFTLLIIALASPFKEKPERVESPPYVKIILDNSKSFDLFDKEFFESFKKELEKHIKVEVASMSQRERTSLGDVILDNLEQDKSLLLITDGQNNKGASLDDVVLYASSLNSSINALSLRPQQDDVSLRVIGPSKTTEGADNLFSVVVEKAGVIMRYPLKVSVDDVVIIDETTDKDEYQFRKVFNPGYHRIIAHIKKDDFFKENNVFYKTVKVVPRPKILVYSLIPDKPIVNLLKQLYDVTETKSLSNYNRARLRQYNALVIDDVPEEFLTPHMDIIVDYVSEGNGLVVIGGKNSFEFGNYKDSEFESILPVSVGSPEKKEGDVNIILLIDISGSTGKDYGMKSAVDVEKAFAIEILNDLKVDHRLAVVAFNTETYLVYGFDYILDNKKVIRNKISRLVDGGGTRIDVGLAKATELLSHVSGSKNIILISDGMSREEKNTVSYSRFANRKGINIFTIGVGHTTNRDLMRTIAKSSNGIFFKASEKNKVNLLFGERKDRGLKDDYTLSILNQDHFITKSLDLSASIYGYNAVAPKSTGQLLVSTDTGEPILTVSRYALGRIAALTTDDGSVYAGQLLNKENSALITKTINWAIGDPERNNKEYINIQDTNLGDATELVIKSESPPKAEGLVFYKIDKDIYSASITENKSGFNRAMSAIFAVNYPKEYEKVGLNKEIQDMVDRTGGELFKKDEIEKIVESIKSQSRKTILKNDYYRWPFIIVALVMLLVEIAIRRIMALKGK